MCTTEIRDLDMRFMRNADRRDQHRLRAEVGETVREGSGERERERSRKTECMCVCEREIERNVRDRERASVTRS